MADAQAEVIEKDQEIFRLTKEVVELRLLKAGGSINEKEERNDHEKSHNAIQSFSQCNENPTPPRLNKFSEVSEKQSSTSIVKCEAKDAHDHPDMIFNGGG